MLLENGMKMADKLLTVSALIPTEARYQGERSAWTRGDRLFWLEVAPEQGLKLHIDRPGTAHTELVEQHRLLLGEMRNMRDWLRFRESQPALQFAEQPEFRYRYEDREYTLRREQEAIDTVKLIENPDAILLRGHLQFHGHMTLTHHASLPLHVPELSEVEKPLLIEYFHVLALGKEPGMQDVAYRAAGLLMERIDQSRFDSSPYRPLRDFVSHALCDRNHVLNFVRSELPGAIQQRNGKPTAEFDRTNIDHMNLVGRFFSQLMHELRRLVESRAFS